MQLSELRLIESVLLSADFKQAQFFHGSVEVRFTYGQITFNTEETLSSDEPISTIIIVATPKATASSEGGIEEFSLNMSIRMVYAYPSTETVSEEFLQENSWYFASFLRTFFKFYADEILQRAGIEGIRFPLN
ncbi:hypothetical protein AA471_13550 [Salmonella enterica subsp. enterica]|nr:hypothetical protein [Salmonella enterica subsp. enterica]ECI0975687.1 hypothetical protein [Salmonella enterica subsp. enterica serovar Newport]ECO0900726.1 hypothetical protein [Salmonella enterica subsp. enterica serovar Newport]EDQ2989957.1 hypothetical protein [Salmonella enterica subsp. enterica]EDT3088140.1 hypothetical protein [Salmonella enterica subsp. enterica serovar Newport]